MSESPGRAYQEQIAKLEAEKAALYTELQNEHYQYHKPGSDLDDCGPSVRKTCLLLAEHRAAVALTNQGEAQ